MTPTEERYAQIEKEALAITWACDSFSDFLMGLVFHIQTDHKPLVPLLSTKCLDELLLGVQRFRMRLIRFQFSISHVQGKNFVTADTLSRAPAPKIMDKSDTSFRNEVEAYVNAVLQAIPAMERRLEEIRRYQEEDEIFQHVMGYCQSDWPAKATLPGVIKPYHQVASQLTVEKGLLMRASKVVIPVALQVSILYKLHMGHQGIVKSREHDKQSVWWPSLSRQLEEVVKGCSKCCKNSSPGLEPLLPSRLPQLPWQKVGTDLFEYNKCTYLLIIDYYSRWIEIAQLSKMTSEDIIRHTSSIFSRHGIPEVVISYNGPQFVNEAGFYTGPASIYAHRSCSSFCRVIFCAFYSSKLESDIVALSLEHWRPV